MSHPLLNKKVILLDSKLKKILSVGECTFIGENVHIGWGLQATVNRTPFTLKSLDQIIEYDDEKVRKLMKLR